MNCPFKLKREGNQMPNRIEKLAEAPDFTLTDTRGNIIRLSAFRGKEVVLVLLRGFT
jgi:peroxiredoxin